MINLLKGEFYKLFKSRAFYVSAAAAAAFVIFIYGMTFTVDEIRSGKIENGSTYVVSEEVPILGQMSDLDVLQQLYANCNIFVIVIFASIFVIGEYANGTVKNVVGKGYARWKIFVSKFISVSVATVLFMLVTTAGSLIAGNIFLKNQTYNQAYFTDLFLYIGIQILISIGICSMSILIAEVSRTFGAGITINFVIATFSTMITAGLDLLVQLAVPDTKFTFSDYWLFDLVEKCPVKDISTEVPVRIILVGIVWLVFTAGLGALHFKKADIK